VSVYLYKRLQSHGVLSRSVLLEGLALSMRRRSSLVEALVSADVRNARPIMSCFGRDGEKADRAWRPDPRLLLDLPPGICERFLGFPFRERAGAVEVATLSPLDLGLKDEFEQHLGRPIALFRASLQALLAAAGAPVDLEALTHSLSEPPPRAGTSPIPLVRKSSRKPKMRDRTRTSPGIGEQASSSFPPSDPYGSDPFQSSPWNPDSAPPSELMEQVRDERELALALGGLLVPPYLVVEIREGLLQPRVTSATGELNDSPISLGEESALRVAALEGKYMGPWSPCPVHSRFSFLFHEGDLVRAERVGNPTAGLVVVQKVAFDGSDDGEALDRARDAWARIQERAALFGA
jgi:hypothetical protein